MASRIPLSDPHLRSVLPPGSGLTSEELLTRAGTGDEHAFELFYQRVAGPILGLVHQLLRNRSQAEEVTQEVLLELWRTACRYRAEKGKAISWALTIAHHRAVDRVREEQARRGREVKATFERRYDRPFDDAAEAAEHEDERDQVRRCLDRLTELQRQAVTMAYYEGHTYAEVATIVGSPAGTVKTRMRDGLIRLRDCLGVTV